MTRFPRTLTLACGLAFATLAATRLAMAETSLPSRVPDEAWPKWSPRMETTWFTPGYQAPDPDGNFHGFRESLVLKSDALGSYVERRLVHMTSSFALRDSTGNPDLTRAEVLWTMPKRALGRIKDARCVIAPDGHIYAYFRADVDVAWPTDFDYPSLDPYGSGGGAVPQIFYVDKPWGGAWSPVTQVTSDTLPTSADPHAVLGALQYAVSLTDAGAPVCFIERVKVSYEPYGGGWIVKDTHTALERISSGTSPEPMSDVLNDVHPTTGNPFRVILGVGSHRGRAVRFVRRLNSDVPRSSSTQPGQLYLFDGTTAILDESLDLDSASPGLALYVQGTSPSAECHVIWRNTAGGRHFTGTASLPSAWVFESLEAEALIEDSNKNLHALGMHHRVRNAGTWSSPDSPGPVNLIGVGIDALDRIYALDTSSDFLYAPPMLSWTWEDNLGVQDGPTMAGAGANSSINLVNGNLTTTIPLFACNGFGPSPSFALNYNSQDLDCGIAGPGWRHSWSMTLTRPVSVGAPFVVLQMADGRSVVFDLHSFDATNAYFYPREKYGVSLLVTARMSGGYVYSLDDARVENLDGMAWIMNADGKVKRIEDRDGNYLTLSYGNNIKTAGVTEENLVEVRDQYGRTVVLEYDDRNRLWKVTDPDLKLYTLVYEGLDGRLSEIRFSGTPFIKWTFTYFETTGLQSPPIDVDWELGISSSPATPGFPWPVEYSGIRGLLATIRTPGMVEMSVAGANDVRFAFRWNGLFPGRVYAAWDPLTDYREPDPDNAGKDRVVNKRCYVTVGYSDVAYSDGFGLYPPGTYQTVYHDRERTTADWKVVAEYDRCIAFKLVDPLDRVTLRVFDARKNVVRTVDPGGFISDFRYVSAGEFGLPGWALDLVKTVHAPGDPLPPLDPLALLPDLDSPLAKCTRYEYDGAARRVNKVTTVTGDETTFHYDSEAHLDWTLAPSHAGKRTVFTYFAEGQVHTITDPEGKLTTYTYTSASYGLMFNETVSAASPATSGPDGVPSAPAQELETRYTWTVMGQPKTVRRPGGGTTVYDYDGLHRLYQTTPPAVDGHPATSIVTTLNADGYATAVMGLDGKTTKTERDVLNRVIRVENPDEEFALTFYTPNSNVYKSTRFFAKGASWKDSTDQLLGGVTTVRTDKVNRTDLVTTSLDAAQSVETSRTFTLSGNVDSVTVAEAGYRKAVDAGQSTALAHQKTAFTYQPGTDLPDETIPPGGDTKFKTYYNARREVISQQVLWKPTGESSFQFYRGEYLLRDALGRVTERLQMTSAMTPPDPWSGESVAIPADWRSWKTEYNSSDEATASTTPLGFRSVFASDGAYRPFWSKDATGVERFTQYTADSLVFTTLARIPGKRDLDAPAGKQDLIRSLEFTYNGRGQRTLSKDILNQTWEDVMDDAGRLKFSKAPGELQLAEYFYDNQSRNFKTAVRKDSTTTLEYVSTFWPQGTVQSKIAPPGTEGSPAWTYGYDLANRMTDRSSPLHKDSFVTYDVFGNVKTTTDEDLNVTTHFYDDRNRLIRSEYKHAGVGDWETITRTYDAVGNPLTIEGADSGVKVQYDYKVSAEDDTHTNEVRRVTWTINGSTWKALRHDYDKDGRRTDTWVYEPNGLDLVETHHLHVKYDAAGRLTESWVNGVKLAAYEYENGYLTSTSFPAAGTQVDRHYDMKGRLDRLTHRKGAEVLAKIVYGFDSRDRRETVDYAHLNLRSTFEYTDNSWLKHETHARLGSASSGGGPEGTNEEVLVDGGNESAPTDEVLCSPTPGPAAETIFEASYDYDLRGNRLAKTVLVGSMPSSTYVPDEEDRLVSESRGGVSISYEYSDRGEMTARTEAGVTTEFTTDFMGRIVGVFTPGKSWSYLYAPTGDRLAKYNDLTPAENEWSLPDAGDTLADYHKTESGEDFSGIYVSPGIDGRVARVDPGGVPQYYFGDALQSVHQMTNAAGAVTGTNLSDAWGNKLAIGMAPPTGEGSRFSYQGREDDNESGLMHFRARSYDPTIGSFLARDPNSPWSYRFGGNAPTIFTDPTGSTLRVSPLDAAVFKAKYGSELRIREVTDTSEPGGKVYDLSLPSEFDESRAITSELLLFGLESVDAETNPADALRQREVTALTAAEVNFLKAPETLDLTYRDPIVFDPRPDTIVATHPDFPCGLREMGWTAEDFEDGVDVGEVGQAVFDVFTCFGDLAIAGTGTRGGGGKVFRARKRANVDQLLKKWEAKGLLGPYEAVGGHHVVNRKTYMSGSPGFVGKALAMSLRLLESLEIRHEHITGAQHSLYVEAQEAKADFSDPRVHARIAEKSLLRGAEASGVKLSKALARGLANAALRQILAQKIKTETIPWEKSSDAKR